MIRMEKGKTEDGGLRTECERTKVKGQRIKDLGKE